MNFILKFHFFYIMFQYYFVTMDDDKMRGNEKMEKKKN